MKKTKIDPSKIYTVEQVAALLGVHYLKAYRWVRSGILPSSRFGQSYMIRGYDLQFTLYRGQRGEIDLRLPRYGVINELAAA